jgi:hypothetical protein
VERRSGAAPGSRRWRDGSAHVEVWQRAALAELRRVGEWLSLAACGSAAQDRRRAGWRVPGRRTRAAAGVSAAEQERPERAA